MDFSKFKEYYTKNGKFKDHFQDSVILLPMTSNIGSCDYNESCGLNGIVGGFFRNLSREKVSPIDNEADAIDRINKYLQDEIQMSDDDIKDFINIARNILCPDGKFQAIDSSFLKYYPFHSSEGKKSTKDKFLRGQEKIADYVSSMAGDAFDIDSAKGRADLFTTTIQNALQSGFKVKKDSFEPEHYYILPFVKAQFRDDFNWLLGKQDAVLIKYINSFTYFYACYSILQTLLHIDPKNDEEKEGKGAICLYSTLSEEKISMKGDAVTKGWDSRLGKDVIEKTFGRIQTIDIINFLTDSDTCIYSELMTQLKAEPFEQNKDVCEKVLQFYQTEKRKTVNSRKTSKEITIKDILTSAESYEEFVKKLCSLCINMQDSNYTRMKKWIYNLFSIGFLSLRRGKYILTVDNDMLIFLIAMITHEEKTKLKDMYAKFRSYGIIFNMNTRRIIEQYLLKLNLLERKSDSGEAQYVRVIL